jgi:hypothetical protein
MAITYSWVQVPAQTIKLETTQHTVDTQTVDRQVINIADTETNTYTRVGADGLHVDVKNQVNIRPLVHTDVVGNVFFAISRGLISGQTTSFTSGRNSDIDSGTEDLIAQGGVYVPPTTDRIHNIAGGVNDTAIGTGARTVLVMGLNASFAEVTETVIMNGTTNVATVNSYVFISRLVVLTAGSVQTNDGVITATAQTDGTISARIDVGFGQSSLCVHQVPAGKTAYMFKVYGSMNVGTTGATADIHLMTKAFGGAWIKRGSIGLSIDATSYGERTFILPLPITEKTLIKLQADSDIANCDISGGFDLVLVNN